MQAVFTASKVVPLDSADRDFGRRSLLALGAPPGPRPGSRLTVEAKRQVEESGLSRRELARRLKTSVPQLYRLLDTTNTKKSINQLSCLLQVLECSVDLVVTDRGAVAQPGRSSGRSGWVGAPSHAFRVFAGRVHYKLSPRCFERRPPGSNAES